MEGEAFSKGQLQNKKNSIDDTNLLFGPFSLW